MAPALSLTSPVPSDSEQELVSAVRRGEGRAFDELYSRYHRRIASYVVGMVGDRGRAEDIAQEVFISALRRLRDTERPIAFKPWIYEIAKNACIDEFRRTRRTQEVFLDYDEEADGARSRPCASAPAPDAVIESKQRLRDLQGAFGGLSENHHKVLVMREFEGLTYAEIGERTGMSRPVVESTLFRARRRLSEEYEELVSGRRCQHVQLVLSADETLSLRSLGTRERRRVARHLAHCQPCRRHARLTGFDESALRVPSLAEKIAALIPIPIPFLRSRAAKGKEDGLAGSVSTPLTRLQTLQTVARFTDPAGASVGLGRAAAAAVTIAIAAAGGGFVSGLAAHTGHRPLAPLAVPGAATTAQQVRAAANGTALAGRDPRRALRVTTAGSALRGKAGPAAPRSSANGTDRAADPGRGVGSTTNQPGLSRPPDARGAGPRGVSQLPASGLTGGATPLPVNSLTGRIQSGTHGVGDLPRHLPPVSRPALPPVITVPVPKLTAPAAPRAGIPGPPQAGGPSVPQAGLPKLP